MTRWELTEVVVNPNLSKKGETMKNAKSRKLRVSTRRNKLARLRRQQQRNSASIGTTSTAKKAKKA